MTKQNSQCLGALPGGSDSLSRFVVRDRLDQLSADDLGGGIGPAGDGLELEGAGRAADDGLDLVALGVELALLTDDGRVFSFLKVIMSLNKLNHN